MEHTLIFGTAYAEPELAGNRTETDLEWLREAGFNLICLTVCWERWEPENGAFDFTDFHRVLSGARSRGMKVILEIPSGACPGWLLRKGVDAAPYQERFLGKLTEQCGAYGCIAGFRLGGDLQSPETLRLRKLLSGLETALPFCRGDLYSGGSRTGMEISMEADTARGSGAEHFVMPRFPSGGRLGRLPYPGQLRLETWECFAAGAGGVCYDGFHPDETGARRGILSHDLSRGRIYRECAQLGGELSRVGERLSGMKKQNRIAIMVSRNSRRNALWPEDSAMGYDDYLKWIYDGFYRLNLEVDMIPDTRRDFTGYALLVTPCLYSAEDNLIWAIRDYVAGGGNLIATFRSFFTDENGRVRRDVQPYGMTDVFGMSYEEYTAPRATNLPEYGADTAEWMELLSLSGARSMGTYGGTEWPGTPAVTCHKFGRGAAAYIGCYSPEGLKPILLRLLSAWHIPVPEISWPVVMKRGTGRQGSTILYLLHYGSTPRVIPCPGAGRELLSGRLLEEGEPLELKPWDVKILEGTL